MILKSGSRGSDVKSLQQQLADAGFNPGPVDGIFGPKTRSALLSFQKAAGITTDGIAGPQTFGALDGWDGESGGTEGDGGGTSGIEEYVRENYPSLAWALDHDELGDILRNAGENEWSPLKLQNAVQATNYWQETSATERQARILQETDPAEWDRRVKTESANVRHMARQLGLSISDADAAQIASDIQTLGITEEQARIAVINAASPFTEDQFEEGKLGGETASTLAQVEDMARAYMIDIDHNTAQKWTMDILRGDKSMESFKQYSERLAVTQNPWVSQFIEQGLTPIDGLQPYQNRVANVLEISPGEVNFADQKWQSVLHVNDGGEQRLASVSEMNGLIRENFRDQWERTSNAKQAAAQTVNMLAETFGRRG